MPQLNPSPWLMIFMLTWMFILLILFNKSLKPMYMNQPKLKKTKKTSLLPWNWPWY